jgi:hypothetical protein
MKAFVREMGGPVRRIQEDREDFEAILESITRAYLSTLAQIMPRIRQFKVAYCHFILEQKQGR